MLRFRASVRTSLLPVALISLFASSAFAAGKYAELRKFVLPAGDPTEGRVLASGAKVLARYQAFTLYGLADTTTGNLARMAGPAGKGVSERLELRGGRFQETRGAGSTPKAVRTKRTKVGGGFRVIQFVGPVLEEWVRELRESGTKVVSYLPENAYVVWVDSSSQASFDRLSGADFVQWTGEFEPSWRRSPEVEAASLKSIGDVDVTVQLLDGPDTKATLSRLQGLARRTLQAPSQVLAYMNVSLTVPASALADISGWPDVFNVEEYVVPAKRDEVQGQIMAGNLATVSGNVVPQGPGYLAWLAGKGFPTTPNSYPVVDVIDDGIDRGDAANIRHPDFRRMGDSTQASRVSYIQTCTSDPLGDGLEGHGNINAGIVGGYNDRTTGFPYQDASGYRYGLGISPYGRLAGTRIFGSTGSWDISRCGANETGIIQRSYAAGARITSNSWGARSYGAYTASSQAFDAGTRDASSTLAGNQEILHVFSAGNSGSGTMTVGAPGTAKNVLTVGATENVRAEGTIDGCGTSASNNADDIIGFSSRGPTTDGRIKPDIMAPGVHITGPASQHPNFNGGSVCGMGASGYYYPLGQTLYTWSSGTSHSCPAVAGTAQLTYEHYGRVLKPGAIPSPAMLKALIVNGARYMTGVSAGGNLPSPNQGWGDVNMASQFDGTARELVDQTTVFAQTGEQFETSGFVADPTKPLRISLVWTDAPGNTTGASYVNDLDLEVTVNGVLYRGNVFSGAFSTTGGVSDGKNNIENVFLPAGTSGSVSVRVVAKNIAGDGIPANADPTDQDFALVAYNVSVTPRAILAFDSVVVRKVIGNPAVGIEPGDSLEIRTSIRNAGTLPLGASIGTLRSSDPQVTFRDSAIGYGALEAGTRAWGSAPFGVRVSPYFPCGKSVVLHERIVSGSDSLVRVILLAGRTATVSDTSLSVPVAIPNSDSGKATIRSTRQGKIASVKVRVGIAHTYTSDLVLSLVSPSGKRIDLARNVGGSGDNFTGTVFDDSAALPISSGATPFTGSFRPASPLSVLRGDSVGGIWTLVARDIMAPDPGTILSFSLEFLLDGAGCATNAAPFVRIDLPVEGTIVVVGDTLDLRATATDDGKPGSGLTVRWSRLSGPGNAEFSDSTASTGKAVFRQTGTYKLRFAATDGQLISADTVTIHVVDTLKAPTGLVATSKPGEIQLDWDSIPGPGLVFEIHRSKGDTLHFVSYDTTRGARYLDRWVKADSVYFYKVASRRGGVTRMGAQIVSARAQTLRITGMKLSAGTRSVQISWSAVAPVGSYPSWSYTVVRSAFRSGPFELVELGMDTLALDTGLVPGTRYYYAITGSSTDGREAVSGLDSIVARGAEPLPAPTGFVATPRSRSVLLRWSAVSSPVRPIVYRLFRMGARPADTLSVALTDTSYLDTGLTNGVTYYYDLRATNRDTSSAPVFASGAPRADTLAAPRNFLATPRSRSVFLRWSPVESSVRPVVYRLFRMGSRPTDTLSFATADSSYLDTGLTNGATYYYDLRAMNRDTSSAPVFASAAPRADTLAVPRNFLATPRSRSVFLRWSAVSSPVRPIVYRLFRMGTRPADTLSVALTDTSYLDTGLTNGATYYYDLRATNRDTSSAPVFASAAPRADTLAAPRNFLATPRSRTVLLRWSAVSSPVRPIVYRLFRMGTRPTDTLSVALMDTSYLDTGLTNGVTYYYDLRATNRDTSSAPVFASAAPRADTLAVPRNFLATPRSRSVFLRWSAVSSPVRPIVYRLFRMGTRPTDTLSVALTDTSYLDTGLTNGVTYYYDLRATNRDTSSAPVFASAVPRADTLAAPTGLTAVGGKRSVALVWNPSQGATSYTIYRGLEMAGFDSLRTVVGTSFADTGLAEGTLYSYFVKASNADGSSLPSATVSARTDPAIPSAPSGVVAVPGIRSVSISWTASTGATSYDLYRSLDSLTFTSLASLATTNWMDTGLVSGAKYWYYLKARNAGGASAASATVAAVAKFPLPAAPTGLVATAGDRSIRLVWAAVPNATTYSVKTSTVAGGPYAVAQSGIVGTSYDLTGLANGTIVYVVVSASNATGEGPNSAQGSATPTAPGGLKILYKVGDASATDNTIRPLLQIVNTGSSAVNLSDLTLRYWYVNEQSKGQVMWCDWAQIGAANVAGTYRALSPSVPGADGFMEVSFRSGAGALPAGGNSGEIQIRITRSDWSNHAETGDWSYDATKTSFGESNRITIYKSGVLVWGTEPGIPTPPSVPSGLRGAAGNRLDTLVWNTAANATSYNVYRNLAGGASTKIGSAATPFFVDTGLVNGTSYVYRVTGVNGGLESAKSDSLVLMPRGTAPTKVVGLAASTGNKLVTLTWTASPAATKYTILRRGAVRATIAGTTFTDTAVFNDSSYVYRVVASNAWGDAPASDSVVAVPRAPVIPGIPSGLRGAAGNRLDTLVWNTAANATSYNVYRNLAGGVSTKIGSATTPFFVDTGLVNGTSYVYRVTGVNGGLESAKSDSLVLMPRGTAPTKVVGLAASTGNKLVTLTWTASPAATKYTILRRGAVRATIAGTTFTDTAVFNDSSYVYRVVASNAWGDAPASDSVVAVPRATVLGLKAQYKVGTTEASTNGIRPLLQLVNTGTGSIPLTEVTVRYWFTNEGTQDVSYWCDWAQVGGANVVGTIRTVSPAKPTADRYLELSFRSGAGSLGAGASTGEIQNRMSKSDWSNFTQTNDASFDASKTGYADHSKVTVYRNGVLVWGVEP